MVEPTEALVTALPKLHRSQSQVATMLRKRGLSRKQARIGSAIALCEAPAKGVQGLVVDFGLVGDLELQTDVWGPSYGGFQIRSLKAQTGTGELRDADQLQTPGKNCDAAVAIFKASHWDPWSTYRSGMYKAYLQDLFPPPPDTHVVIGGETLSSIAPKYGLSWEELARLNNIRAPYTIFIGQYLLYTTL